MIASRLQSASAKMPSTFERSEGQSLTTSSSSASPSSSPDTAFSIASWLRVPPSSSASSASSTASASSADSLELALLDESSSSLLPHAAATSANANRTANRRNKLRRISMWSPLLGLIGFHSCSTVPTERSTEGRLGQLSCRPPIETPYLHELSQNRKRRPLGAVSWVNGLGSAFTAPRQRHWA